MKIKLVKDIYLLFFRKNDAQYIIDPNEVHNPKLFKRAKKDLELDIEVLSFDKQNKTMTVKELSGVTIYGLELDCFEKV